mmetsp:Transcript_30556/g.63757  ORF Transcript_30556/g.63757 Transcript_30556/m.63757 type:complete len:160 (+) Transcript_30556:1109-1588(+)
MERKGRTVTYINRACNGGVMKHFTKKRLLGADIIPYRPPLLDEIISEDGIDCNRYFKPQNVSVSEDMDVEKISGAKNALLHYKESTKVISNDIGNNMKAGRIVILSSYPYLLNDSEYILESANDGYHEGTAIRDLAIGFDAEQRLMIEEVNQANEATLA